MSPMVKSPLSLELALLGFLRQRPTHAYEIHQMLVQTEALGLVWHLKQSQLYALLSRLEEAGHITSTTEPQGNRPPRKVLELSPSGRAAFERWLRSPVEHARDFRLEFLARLYFAREEGHATATELVERQRGACRSWLVDLRSQAGDVRADRPYDLLVFEFRIGQVEAILAWLDTCEAALGVPALAR